MTERERPALKATTIRVKSEFDPDSRMVCHGQPAIQRQINYMLTINNETFKIPQVWASVCTVKPQDDIYFAPEVSIVIDEAIFKRQHPLETKIAELENKIGQK